VLQIPTFGFLYIAGWIGYVGREYLNIVKKEKSPTEKEIIIDVPLALNVAGKGAGWPIRVIAVSPFTVASKGAGWPIRVIA
jgi:photosystem I subunit 3